MKELASHLQEDPTAQRAWINAVKAQRSVRLKELTTILDFANRPESPASKMYESWREKLAQFCVTHFDEDTNFEPRRSFVAAEMTDQECRLLLEFYHFDPRLSVALRVAGIVQESNQIVDMFEAESVIPFEQCKTIVGELLFDDINQVELLIYMMLVIEHLVDQDRTK